MHGVARLPRDVWAGLVFVAIGLVALIQVRRYPVGMLTAMGPGYFPLILSVLLICLGLASAAKGLLRAGPPEMQEPARWPLLPLAFLVAGIALFGSLVEESGLLSAVFVLSVPTSVVICLDGHPMVQRGRAGAALCISAIGSFFAGCISILVVVFFSPPLAHAAFAFGPVENAAMIVMALITASAVSDTPMLTTVAMSVLGVLLGTACTDVETGTMRLTFGSYHLADGVNFVAVAVGLFAFAEVLMHLAAPEKATSGTFRIRGLVRCGRT